jgi:hypothetical protein
VINSITFTISSWSTSTSGTAMHTSRPTLSIMLCSPGPA